MQRLTDDQWERFQRHFPEEFAANDRRGRKPSPACAVFDKLL